jgi:hypothetical protein
MTESVNVYPIFSVWETQTLVHLIQQVIAGEMYITVKCSECMQDPHIFLKEYIPTFTLILHHFQEN